MCFDGFLTIIFSVFVWVGGWVGGWVGVPAWVWVCEGGVFVCVCGGGVGVVLGLRALVLGLEK